MKDSKKEFLFNDIATYNTFKSKEDNLFKIFEQLKETSIKALGNTAVDYKKYLEDPAKHLVNEYWILFANVPKHLEDRKESIFESHTGIRIQAVKDLHKDFLDALKQMQGYKPTINKSGLKSTLKKSQFDKYLDNNKADKFHVLKRMVEAANELSKYENVHGISLIRFCNHLRWNNQDIVINYHDFAL